MSLKITNVEGYIVPISNTKVRESYSTYSADMGVRSANSIVYVDQVIERLETDPSKIHDHVGDVWGRIAQGDPDGGRYMAIEYHNTSTFAKYFICNKFYSVKDDEVPPTENTVFPDFILVYGTVEGQKIEKTYTETSSKEV